jgi:tetratricopeptide (TPR) repeat protein/predicted  nucleic acid-binding Zn-ribbon protein
MLDWIAHWPRARTAVLLGWLALVPLPAANGQEAAPPAASAQFDPSDVYFQGYLAVRAAEQLEAAGDFIGALEKLEKAGELFGAVRKFHPDWKPEMVGGRSNKTQETISRVRPLAEQGLQKNRNAVAELEGGIKKSGRTSDPAKATDPPPAESPEVDARSARRLQEAEAEVRRLRDLASQSRQSATQDASRMNDLKSERDALQKQLQNAESAAKKARADLAAAQAEREKNRNTVTELEARIRQSAQANRDVVPLTPGILEVDPLAARRLEEAEAEVKRLRDLAENRNNEASRNASRVNDLARQRDLLQSQLRAAENNVRTLRNQLAAAPVEKEMTALNQRIANLEQEREAMAMALTQSRGAHTDALARIATLEADLNVMRQKHADLERDIGTERKIANSVVAGQRRQLDALERELEKKNTELSAANQRISGLMSELRQSHEAFTQLRSERDSLLLERDQMAALLKLNEAGRIQDLIEQNMALAKTLRESNEKVDRLNRESNADKDAYTDALRDLAIAKSQINRLHQDKREQDRRLAELEDRLKNEEQALAQGRVAADPAEVEVLRDIIKRQLRVQERRRQARDLLVEAARELGAKDERLAQAIGLFDAQEIALTPEEQKLIDNKQVDGEFISPFARDRASVSHSTAELNRDIAVFERTAEKSFIAGRLLPTRELFEMILEQHPGHTPSLCKLGVVHLRLEEPAAAADSFRRAVELDARNAYACRMLGFSLMKLGDLPAAEQAVKRAVELAPTDAKSQMLLATLCYRLGRAGEAESYFKAAITADPMPSEPYYNLALLCSRDRRMEDAKNYYQQALERGALPDPALEEKLAKQ